MSYGLACDSAHLRMDSDCVLSMMLLVVRSKLVAVGRINSTVDAVPVTVCCPVSVDLVPFA